ncbi:MAG: hypothetical protein EXS36_03985 [Pedosphaera sp.]|nr:hypothetical protein [Pedosphaera sp.]
MKTQSTPSHWLSLGILFGLLLTVAALSFSAVLWPAASVFANDGPFGRTASACVRIPEAFMRIWSDLNWLGNFGGNLLPNFTFLFFWLFGPVGFSRYYAPATLVFLGFAFWFLGRRLGFRPAACVLVGLAASLNSDYFSYAAWGLGTLPLCIAMAALAMGTVASSVRPDWARWPLAGVFVGLAIMEGFDNGAIFSVFVAAFAVWWTVVRLGTSAKAWSLGFAGTAVIAIAAALTAANILVTLIQTQITGVVGTKQDAESKADRWSFATSWSFPKKEVVRFLIPGIMGYRMDTADGGAYWGEVGPTGTAQGRHNGNGQYPGVLLLMVAAWAVARAAASGGRQPFSGAERKMIAFFAIAGLWGLLLGFGRFAPFYQVVFHLPYFSTIRIPAKFIHVTQFCLLVLFGFGLDGMIRLYAKEGKRIAGGLWNQVQTGWGGASDFERHWMFGVGLFGVLGVAGAMTFTGSKTQLAEYLGTLPYQGVPSTAGFAIREVWLFVLILAVSIAALVLVQSGWFVGAGGSTLCGLLGLILVIDLLRAVSPWVVTYNRERRYQTNPVLDVLRQKPWEHRVSGFIDPHRGMPLAGGAPDDPWIPLHYLWVEQLFPFFNIQTLDISQMPREPELDAAYFKNFRPASAAQLSLAGRLWELTNTRYILATRGTADQLNQAFDPGRRRFREVLAFSAASKPGRAEPKASIPLEQFYDDITVVAATNGPYALFEFSGALPRVMMHSRVEVLADDAAVLSRLRDSAFDPAAAVVLPGSSRLTARTNGTTGTAAIRSYRSDRLVISAESPSPGVLLLNDRWDPNWNVTVDGKPSRLLRANHLMRGVEVPAGSHEVIFELHPPLTSLWISLSALFAALALFGIVSVNAHRDRTGQSAKLA